MTVLTVRLHGGLERYCGSAGPVRVDLLPGAALLELQDQLRIPRGEVGVFVVDGELRHEGYTPADGAMIDIYPMFGGG